MTEVLVVIQMGHCFRKTGSTGTNGVDGDPNEQEFAHAAANTAAAMLHTAGHDVRIIHADEADSMYAGDAFVAFHCDGSTNPSAAGASVGYRTAEGAHLGAAFKQAYADAGWKGFRPDNYTDALAGYYGNKKAIAQGNEYAVIVECGFLTNPQDESRLSLPDGPDRVARALTNTITATFGGTSPGDDMPLTQSDLNAIKSIVRDSLLDFQRLPVIWAGQSRPTHWYWWSHVGKVLVTSTQAHALVDNAMAEWSGTRAGDPDGIGQAAIVPDDILALAPTIGADEYPPAP